MDKTLKRKWINVYTVTALAVGVLAGILFNALDSYFSYDYRWIIGKHYEEIIANYGEFDAGNAEFIPEDRRYNYDKYFIEGVPPPKNGEPLRYRLINNTGTYELLNPFKISNWVSSPNLRCIIIEFDNNGYAVSVSIGRVYKL